MKDYIEVFECNDKKCKRNFDECVIYFRKCRKKILNVYDELLELRKNAPKFTIGQKVWVVVEHPSGEYHCVCDGVYSGKREIHTVDGIIMELNQIHNTKSEAQAECRKRNGEKK